jgi:Flp pilus assembly protein TadG
MSGSSSALPKCARDATKFAPIGYPKMEITTMSLARFFKDRKAGVAPMLALCIIPLIGSVGAAVDYSRANSVRAAMQAAGDATAHRSRRMMNQLLRNTQ